MSCLSICLGNADRFCQKSIDEVQTIRKADLENHNKDGGLWVVIHGKVYDVQDFKSQAPCGSDTLSQHAGTIQLLNPFTLKRASEIVVWINDTFDYTFGMKNDFTKYLKENCW